MNTPSIPLWLADAHCDTAYELNRRNESLEDNSCHISLSHTASYGRYAQIFALWCDRRWTSDSYARLSALWNSFQRHLMKNSSEICHIRTRSQWVQWCAANPSQPSRAAFTAVEDGRWLEGRPERFELLRRMGAVYLTFFWSGENGLGGAHDVSSGLTPLGRQMARTCFAQGVLPDVSHASVRSTDDLLDLAVACGRPLLASHSNAYSVYPHTRNLRDQHFAAIRDLGGVVGLNLCCEHLTDTQLRPATLGDVVRHLEHSLSLGGERTLVLGCDLDGATPPEPIHHVGQVALLAEELRRLNYSESLIHQLFWGNLADFLTRALPEDAEETRRTE